MQSDDDLKFMKEAIDWAAACPTIAMMVRGHEGELCRIRCVFA
jgi:hypothetical protein